MIDNRYKRFVEYNRKTSAMEGICQNIVRSNNITEPVFNTCVCKDLSVPSLFNILYEGIRNYKSTGPELFFCYADPFLFACRFIQHIHRDMFFITQRRFLSKRPIALRRTKKNWVEHSLCPDAKSLPADIDSAVFSY